LTNRALRPNSNKQKLRETTVAVIHVNASAIAEEGRDPNKSDSSTQNGQPITCAEANLDVLHRCASSNPSKRQSRANGQRASVPDAQVFQLA